MVSNCEGDSNNWIISAEKCSSKRASRNVVNIQTHKAREKGPSGAGENASEKVFISNLCVSITFIFGKLLIMKL